MAGYYGTPAQQRLMRLAEEQHDAILATPGLCQVARMMGTDDPGRLGWDVVFDILDRDGLFGFRMVPAGDAPDVGRRLAERGYRWDIWQVYSATAGDARRRAGPVAAAGLPDGYREIDLPDDPEGPAVRAVQSCMAECGVTPFSGSMLLGHFAPAVTIAVADDSGRIVATAHACRPYNAHSRFADAAWGGLVAVSEAARGRGLGAYVNARAVAAAFERLGAGSVHELVRAGNVASTRMVEACGLRLDPSFVCGAATRGEARFTA